MGDALRGELRNGVFVPDGADAQFVSALGAARLGHHRLSQQSRTHAEQKTTDLGTSAVT